MFIGVLGSVSINLESTILGLHRAAPATVWCEPDELTYL
jgi:hypothetical protein